MKKFLISVLAFGFVFSTLNAQVLDKSLMKNTSWVGFGAPIDGDPMFYGFTDTFQARFDIGKFTIEGMLNWSFLANYDNEGDVDNFTFGTSNANPLSLKYGTRGNTNRAGENTLSAAAQIRGYNNTAIVSNTLQDSYYVNFVWHPVKNFDFGVGTKLNWQVGPAPRYGSWLWESDAHIRQGGFSTTYDDRSGSVGTYQYNIAENAPGKADVVGFVPYANKYAKSALGVRYITNVNGISFQLGAAIPNGFNTDNPCVNLGFQIGPTKWISLAAAIEGAFNSQANIYTGATFGFNKFILDAYFAADSLFSDADNDEAYGTGAKISFYIPGTQFKIIPEIGINFFENGDYTPAWYTCGSLIIPLNTKICFDIFASFANGSKNKEWEDSSTTETWDGGNIFNLRPSISFEVSKHTSLSTYIDFEGRTAFDGTSRKCWSSGVFMTYIF